MRLLILGGTVFLGRCIVEECLRRGHQITLFNRGQHHPDLFPEVEKLRGDRDGGLGSLRGRRWNAVIDTCGYYPRIVRASAELLADAVEHCTFVSSLSVYADLSIEQIGEEGRVGRIENDWVEEITEETYGPLKALCEEAVEEVMPGRVLQVRPGLIVGPHDPSDRFTYWVERVARGGEVLVPGRSERQIQLIDARDLAAWVIERIDERTTGVFNAVGPAYRLSMGEMVEQCRAVSGIEADLVWVGEEFLTERGVAAWTELPLWLPETGEFAGLFTADCSKAIDSGLRFRAIEETILDTLSWSKTLPPDRPRRAGLAPDRETELLDAWAAGRLDAPPAGSPRLGT